MNRKIILGLSLMSIFATSCQNNEPAQQSDKPTIEFQHKLGTTQIVESPERVVIFDIGAMETFDELGLPMVGLPLSNLPNHLAKYKDMKEIGDIGTVKEANFEKVHALNPDLIIISIRLEASYDEFSKIAPTIFYDVDPNNYMASFKENTRLIGRLYGKEEEVEKHLNQIDQDIENTQSKAADLDQKSLIVLYNNSNFSAFGKGSRFGFIHDILGVPTTDEGLDVSRHGQKISNEYILEQNPDILYVVDRNVIVNSIPTNKSDVENTLIQQTNAYKNGKIFYLDPQVWYLSQGGITSMKKMIREIEDSLD